MRAGHLDPARPLAEQTVETLSTVEHRVPPVLAMTESELELGVRKPDPEWIAWAKSVLSDRDAQVPHRWSYIFAREALHLAGFPERTKIKLQAVRIGDVAVVAVPCEVFASTGLALKRDSPFPHTFTVSLANGSSGYLPPPKQMAWGGYETWPARTSRLEAQAEPKIRAELLRLLNELRD